MHLKLILIVLTLSNVFSEDLQIDSTKIVGGRNIDISKVPWQVSFSVLEHGIHFCGGSIIDRYKILTAAHCLSDEIEFEILVRFGTNNRLSGGYVRRVSQIVRHKNFDIPTEFNNDIAIVFVTHPIIYGRKIQPIALPEANHIFIDNDKVLISGWGDTEHDSDKEPPVYLQGVTVPIVDQELCAHIYNETNDWEDDVVTKNMFCAGVLNVGGKDSCQGDSGGPVVLRIDSKPVLVGIVSFGHGCGLATHPGIYTRISRYIDWIQNVTINETDTSARTYSIWN